MMAYFESGDLVKYVREHCIKCRFTTAATDDRGFLSGHDMPRDCPVYLFHEKAVNWPLDADATEILDALIPIAEDGKAGKCKMFEERTE